MARTNVSSDSALRNATSEYGRASCEYQTSSGLQAVSAAAMSPTRRETSSLPARYAVGTIASPTTADSDLSGASPKPNMRAQPQASMEYSGGVDSRNRSACSIPPKVRCSCSIVIPSSSQYP